MSETTKILPDLIEATREGVGFYEAAAQKVQDKELVKLFRQMAQAKAVLVHELESEVPRRAGRRSTMEWLDEIRNSYRAAGKELGKVDLEFVSQLEQAESCLLEQVHAVRFDRGNSFLIRVLAMQYEGKAGDLHGQLKSRKKRLMTA
ncbi:DUF2383 domain-containing protein [Rehaibacterium terrae]|jgi:uncharacterized protein (TIGR02284 family)|uniref:Uncharacterized protein (TIGR02284 family) n=1 Tax=Rehaibacterium terrae TaxID=1341696 RepID=A0A7W7Y0S6_9GAMM|nr:DUF2383 domain-containing protein [Rehaibacterium terrae]MBB5015999.1 uncharacterized protein (TIGR02284 family) [Rehaibacterium terrae]MDX5410125.1 PA2169 family four-helix-bundle protein [Thauera sp.]